MAATAGQRNEARGGTERTHPGLQFAADLASAALGVRVQPHEIAPLVGLIESAVALRREPMPHHRAANRSGALSTRHFAAAGAAPLAFRKSAAMGRTEIATDWMRSAALRAAFIERRYDWQALEKAGLGVRAAYALTRIRELNDEGAGAC